MVRRGLQEGPIYLKRALEFSDSHRANLHITPAERVRIFETG